MTGQTQDGYVSEENMQTCEDCDETMHEDESRYIESCGRTVCESCRENNYTTAIGRRGYEDWYSNDDCIYCETDGSHYVEEYASDNEVYQCEKSGGWFKMDDLVFLGDDGYVQQKYAVELDVDRDDGSSWALKDDVVLTHDGRTIHCDDAVMKTVYFHKDDDIENDQTPVVAAQQVA